MDPTMISVFAVGATLLGVGASLAAILVVSVRSLRTEMAAVETRLGKRIDAMRGEMKEVETRLGERIEDTRTDLRTEINAVETRLGKRIDGLDNRVSRLDRRVILLEAAVSRLLGPRWRPALPEPAPDDSPA